MFPSIIDQSPGTGIRYELFIKPATEAMANPFKGGINEDFFAKILESINQSLENGLLPQLLHLPEDEAAKTLNNLNALDFYVHGIEAAKDYMRNYNQGIINTRLDIALLDTAKMLIMITKTLEIASTPVDEDSDDYAEFIEEMCDKAAAEGQPIYGRKALFALFED